MIFSRKEQYNEKDAELVKSVLSIINTQKENVTVLEGLKNPYSYEGNYTIKFAVMMKNTRLVFTIYRANCFGLGRLSYALYYNNDEILCDQSTLKELFDKLPSMDNKSKESLYSLI